MFPSKKSLLNTTAGKDDIKPGACEKKIEHTFTCNKEHYLFSLFE